MKLKILTFVLLIVFSGCKVNIINDKSVLIDELGYKVEISKPVKRIVSIAPNITETIYAIGADSLLVGISNYCNFPEESKYKTKVGGLIDPNIEVISSLQPDVVFMTVEGNSKLTHSALDNANIKVYTTNPRNIIGILAMIDTFGELTGKTDNARLMHLKIDSVAKNYSNLNIPKTKTLILVSINPFITINKSTYINEIASLTGFENIYKNEELPYPNINTEDIVLKNPECIILTSEIATNDYLNFLKKQLGNINAIKNNNIIVVDADILSRPGPRVIQALDFLYSKRNFK